MSEAPAELWMRERQRLPGRWYQTHYADEPSAVRYVRADLYEKLLHVQQDLEGMTEALKSAEDNDVDGVERILRTGLKLPPEADYPR
jgi:hypothetical protein